MSGTPAGGGIPAGGAQDPTDPAAALALAELVLGDAVAAGGAGAEVEVAVARQGRALTRFANSAIHQNVAADATVVRLRVHRGGRTAEVSTTVTTGDGPARLVAHAMAVVAAAPPDPTWPGLVRPWPARSWPTHADPATAAATPAERAAVVLAFVDAAGGLPAAGYCATQVTCEAFVNSAGHAVADATTAAGLDAIVRGATGAVVPADGLARRGSTRLAEIDGGGLGTVAAAKARAAHGAVDLAPGHYEVVLEPAAVANLLETMGLYGFAGRQVAERCSFVELGGAQFDPAVTLVDDPLADATAGLRFDADGAPRGTTVLVDAGVSLAVAHDRRTAARVGASATGHAMPGGAWWGPVPTHLSLLPAPGGAAPCGTGGSSGTGGSASGAGDGLPVADASVVPLVAGVRRGLLVSDNWYTRVLDPRTLVVTGLTRNGVWLIENGEVTRPVANLRFTQSYPAALAPGTVLGVGTTAVPLVTTESATRLCAPALRLAGWHYTGGAAG